MPTNTGLRIHDNPSLLAACRSPQTKVYPIFILDPHFLKPELIGGVRITFLLESLACLDEVKQEDILNNI